MIGRVLMLLSVLTVPACLRAQAAGGSRAAMFLTLPSSARALALGEAWGAVADDAGALFYNPAQLARVHGTDAQASVQRYVAGTTLASVAVATPLGRGAVALGVRFLDYGSVPEMVISSSDTPETGVPTGAQVSAQDVALSLGYGYDVSMRGRLRVGASVTWAQQHVASYAGAAVVADVGAAWTAPTGWEIAAALQNAGGTLRLAAVASPMPLTWRASVAAPVVHADRVTVRELAEVRQTSGGVLTGVLGAEGVWRAAAESPQLSVRVGYAFRGAGEDRLPLTAGLGLGFGRIAIDYAYEGFDLMGGATHRVGVRFSAAPNAR